MNQLANNQQEFKSRNRIAIASVMLVSCMLLFDPASAQAPKNSKANVAIDSGKVEQLFFSALNRKTVEDNTEAASLFGKVLQIDPANDASMYELANIKKTQNDYAGARPLLEKAVTIKPDNTWYWLALADVYEKNNDFGKLEKVFVELIRLNPDKTDIYFDKANALFLQNKYDEALKVYDDIEKITGSSDELILNRQKIYLKQGKVDKAADGLEQMIVANPNQIKYYLLLAEIYNSNNLNDKSLKVLEKAKKVEPNNGMVHLALADIYRDKKNNEASFSELELAFAIPDLDIEQKIRIVLGYIPKFPDANAKASALALSKILVATHPDDARAYALYGDMLLQNEKVKDAKANYQKSIALNNQVYDVREQMVRVEISEGNFDGVIKDGEDALSYFPNQVIMNYFVGLAWLQKKEYKKALGYLKNATAVDAQDKELLSQCYSALGDCYHEMQNIKSSDEAYEKSLSYNADNVYTLNNYAYYLSVRGEQLEKAAQMAKHANEVKPNEASFEDTYAWILFKQKKYPEAKVWIEKAVLHNKDKSAVQTEHYGDILFFTGDINGAVQNWKKAKEYGGHSPALERKINERKYSE